MLLGAIFMTAGRSHFMVPEAFIAIYPPLGRYLAAHAHEKGFVLDTPWLKFFLYFAADFTLTILLTAQARARTHTRARTCCLRKTLTHTQFM